MIARGLIHNRKELVLDVVNVVHVEEIGPNKLIEPKEVSCLGGFGHTRSLAPRASLAPKVLCNLDHVAAGSSQSQMSGQIWSGRVS